MIARTNLRRTTNRRVAAGVLVAVFAPGFLLGLLALLRLPADWHELFPTASSVNEAVSGIPFLLLITTLSGASFGLLFVLPALALWALLHRLGITHWLVFSCTGLIVGICAALSFGSGLPPHWFEELAAAGAVTGLLVWLAAYAGRPIAV